MASIARLMKTPTGGDPSDVAIPSVNEHPDFVAALALLSAFSERLRLVDRAVARIGLERHFGDRPVGDDRLSDQPLRQRLMLLRADPPLAPSKPTAPDAPSSSIAAGLAVLAGETVAAPPNYREQLEEFERQRALLGAAIEDQREVVDTVAAALSFEYCKQLTPAWDMLQIEFYRAAQRLAQIAKQVNEFRRAALAAGIRPRSDMLLTPNVRAPLMLGDEAQWGSEIAQWRRILETWGLLK